MTNPAVAPKKPKGALITGIVLFVLSIMVFIGGIVWGAVAVATTVSDSPVFRSPGQVTTTLDAGDHALWTPINGSYLFAEDVTITGPSGEVTATDYFSSNTTVTVTKGSTSYSPEVTFNAPTSGSYTVVVSSSGPNTDVLVGPPSDIVGSTFIIIAAAFGIASIIGIIGIILFIVGLVARSRASKAQRPPPGTYGTPGPYGQAPAYGQPTPYGQPGGYGQPPAQPPGGAPPAAPPPYGQPPAAPPAPPPAPPPS